MLLLIVDQIRLERIPPVLQTGVHTICTPLIHSTGRETRTHKIQILNLTRLPISPFPLLLICQDSNLNKESQSLLC